MKKFGYFEKLSLASRWFLPWEEAKGVIEDYRDILMEVKGPEEAVKRFGTPVQAVLATADRKNIVIRHFMLLLFAVLSFLPVFLQIKGFYSSPAAIFAAVPLMILVFVWYGGDKSKEPGIPKGLAVSCGLLALFLILLCGAMFYFSANPLHPYVRYMGVCLEIIVPVSAISGLRGIACAQLFGSRWKAAVILCVTTALASMCCLSLIHCMAPIADPVSAFRACSWKCVLVSLCGMAAAGMSLC